MGIRMVGIATKFVVVIFKPPQGSHSSSHHTGYEMLPYFERTLLHEHMNGRALE
jgi:hypothetical protein